MTDQAPRIAVVGMMLESNAFAPVATEADFRAQGYLVGEELMTLARTVPSPCPTELTSFVATMDCTGPWTPVPIVFTGCTPWGPVEGGFFRATVAEMATLLADAGDLDGVYIANHGAMVASDDDDPDGAMFQAIRQAAGPDAAIVTTLDLHANISERMVEETDMIIGYRTNPHVDMALRGEEAAHHLRRMLAGERPKMVLVRLPLAPPSVTLLSADGPYGDMIDFGQRRKQEYGGRIANVSVFGGFLFSDTRFNGIATVVSDWEDGQDAGDLAREIASRGWRQRERFQRQLTSIEDAVDLAVRVGEDRALPANIYSDAGDNPGGGGEGRTTWLLAALAEAGAKQVLYGSFFDPTLAARAHEVGVGGRFQATFNSDFESEFSKPFTADAEVLALSDGEIVGRLGITRGRALRLGLTAALALNNGDIAVMVISNRQQTADPIFFEHLGFDVGAARTVCVKSRGHFRAGFISWFPPEQVLEVDTAGLTSPVPGRFDFKNLPRPVYPLDPDTKWRNQ